MTSFPSAADPGTRRGFTLVELLIVMAILALIMAITVAFIARAKKQAQVVKAKAELNAISAAVEQFKTDHGFYPVAADPQPILAEAMIGPGRSNEAMVLFNGKLDGVDGPGFNTRGKNWQPYLPADAYLVEKLPSTGMWLILDRYDHPILYMPKRKNLPPQTINLVQESGTTASALFDTRDGNNYNRSPRPSSKWEMRMAQALLGDDDLNNRIDSAETITNIPNFILASPGPDQQFTKFEAPPSGRKAGDWNRQRLRKSDDVFNIEP